MRRITNLIAALALAVLMAPAAMASTQPDNGAVSSHRNANAVAGGPHCHIVVASAGKGHFDYISVYPSHKAHVATGLPAAVFMADPDCNGMPGAQ